MRSPKLVLFIMVSLLFAQCKTTKFTNAYKRIQKPTQTITSPTQVVQLYFTSKKYKPVSKKKAKKSIFDLSELAQYKLIAQYGENDKTSKALRANLIEPLEKGSTKTKKIINDGYSSFPTRFTFFINDQMGKNNPANRIVSLKIKVTLKRNEVQFKQFNGFQTKYEYYDIGTIESTASQNFSLGASVGAGTTSSASEFDDNGNEIGNRTANFGPSVTGSLGGTNSVKENILLKRRVISQAGSLSSDQMTLYLEGTPQRNLNGPISVELTMESDPSYSNLIEVPYANFNIISKPSPKIIVMPKILYKPTISSDIEADIEMEWLYRRVVENGNTSFEGDDVIEYYKEDGHQYLTDAKILKTDDFERVTFEIEVKATGGGASIPLFFQKNSGRKHPIRFLNQEEAIRFLDYVSENDATSAGGYKIVKSNGTQITTGEIRRLEILKNAF